LKPACVADFRAAARRRLPKVLFEYIDGGSYGEVTLAANVADLTALALRQRVMRDVSALSTATRLFGQDLSMPVILAPVGMAGMYARRGETQAARAALDAGIPFSLSTMGVCPVAEVAAAAVPPWFQLYMIKDRGFMGELLAVARRTACPVLLFTVDLPVPGARYRDARNGLTTATPASRLAQAIDGLAHPGWLWDVMARGGPHTLGNLALGNLTSSGAGLATLQEFMGWIGRNFDPSVTWKDIEWVRDRWPGPLVLKGVLDVEDARDARRCGVDGLVVSNHGGRQLDGAPSSIAALPAVAQAVGEDLAVLMDGGVRSGLDVLRALALGAKACLIGRPWAWALGSGGRSAVAGMLESIRQELRAAMALTGCVDVLEADRTLLVAGGRA
jgi:L-lactate dehydrogenase (cytochrome)